MQRSRREFLKLSSLSALGLALLPVTGLAVAAGKAAGPSGPAGPPAGRRKLAMVVDTRKCDGCQACVKACHQAHNVPAIADAAEAVKWIWPEPFEAAFPGQWHAYGPDGTKVRAAMVMCNHCENPACVRVCPTGATYRNTDGIIMMDYHRCVGCRYCMAACPYGARSFNFQDPRAHMQKLDAAYPTREKGVVEKCSFCAERLSGGGAPLCVEACPQKALIFGDLGDEQSAVRQALRSALSLRRKPELGTDPRVYYLI